MKINMLEEEEMKNVTMAIMNMTIITVTTIIRIITIKASFRTVSYHSSVQPRQLLHFVVQRFTMKIQL